MEVGSSSTSGAGAPTATPLVEVLCNKYLPEYDGFEFSVTGEGDGQRYTVTAWRGYGDNRPPVWVRGVVSRHHGGRGWDTSILGGLLLAVHNGTADTDDRFESVSDVIDGVERTVIEWTRPPKSSGAPGCATDAVAVRAPGPSSTPPTGGGTSEPPPDRGLSAKKASAEKGHHRNRPRPTVEAADLTQLSGPADEEPATDRSPLLKDRHTHPLDSSPSAHDGAPPPTPEKEPDGTEGRYQSDVPGVFWAKKGMVWVSSWNERGDPKNKRFHVKEHGFDKAKALAEEHRRKMERTGRAAARKRSEHQSGVRGVHCNKGANAWVASWQVGDRRRSKSFSINQLGYEKAKQAAIAYRQEMEQRRHTSESEATGEESRSRSRHNDDDDDDEILSPRRHGPPSSRPHVGVMEGGDLAAALVEVLNSDESCGLCWQDGGFRVRVPSSLGEGAAERILDVPVVDLSSRSAVIDAFRRAVEELNRLSTASEGEASAPLDISWLDDIGPHGCNRPRTRRRSGARRKPMPPPSLSEDPSDHTLDSNDPMAPHIQPGRRHRCRPSYRVSERPIADSSSSENELLIDRPAAKRHREDAGSRRDSQDELMPPPIRPTPETHRRREGEQLSHRPGARRRRDRSGGGKERIVSAKLSEGGGHALAASLVEQAQRQLADAHQDDADSFGLEWRGEEATFVAYRQDGEARHDERVFSVSDVTSSRLILRAFAQAAQHCNTAAGGGVVSMGMRRINLHPQPKQKHAVDKGTSAGAASKGPTHHDGGGADLGGVGGDDDMDWADDVSSRDGQPRRKAGKGKTVSRKPAEHQSAVQGVHWSERGDKYFYVKEHGFDKAKELAERHRREMERTRRVAAGKQRSGHQSGVRGVSYDETYKRWVASWSEGGRRINKHFSVAKLGYEPAKQAAIAYRREVEERHYTPLGGDSQPVHQPPSSHDSAAGHGRAEASRPQPSPPAAQENDIDMRGGSMASSRHWDQQDSCPGSSAGVDRGGSKGLSAREVDAFAHLLIERTRREQPELYTFKGRGGLGISWHQHGHRFKVAITRNGKDVCEYMTSLTGRPIRRVDIVNSFRQGVLRRNEVFTEALGSDAILIDISWLDDHMGDADGHHDGSSDESIPRLGHLVGKGRRKRPLVKRHNDDAKEISGPPDTQRARGALPSSGGGKRGAAEYRSSSDSEWRGSSSPSSGGEGRDSDSQDGRGPCPPSRPRRTQMVHRHKQPHRGRDLNGLADGELPNAQSGGIDEAGSGSDDSLRCWECGKGDNEKLLLLCDKRRCSAAYHTYCVQLTAVPEGQWLCPKCKHNSDAPVDAHPHSTGTRQTRRMKGQGDPPRRPAPKRKTVDRKRARDEAELDGLTGPVLATALVDRLIRRFNDACPQANGGFGVCMTSPRRFAAYFDSQGKHLGFRKFVIDDPDSRGSIIDALRQCVAYRNSIHRDQLGDRATIIDLSWLDRQQQGGEEELGLSVRDKSSDHSRSRKHRRRDAALASRSPSVAERRPSPNSHKTTKAGQGIRRAAEHQSDVSGVHWCEQHQAWLAKWCNTRDGKREYKYFYVRKHGFDKAKGLAEQHRREMESTGRASILRRSKHQSGVEGVSYHKKVNAWQVSWQEAGKQKRKSFYVKQLGFEGAKEAAIAHRQRMERLDTSEGGAESHGDPADSRSADDGDDPLPVKQRLAPQLRQGGLRGGAPLHPTARPDTKRQDRRDGRPNHNPSPEASSWLREGPPGGLPTHRTASRGPRVSPVQQGHLIRHFYQQLEALGRAHPETPLCLRFRSGSALTQLAVEVVLPGSPVQSVPLSAATREAMGAAIDAAWACRQQGMDIHGTEDQQPMTHAQRMVLCREYGQVGHNIGAMLAAVPALSFASIDSFVRHELPAMVGQRDGEDIKEAASRFIKQLQKTNQQHTTPALPKPLKAADDEQLPGGDELADIDMTMRPPPYQPVKGPHAPNVPQERDPNEAGRMADGEVGEGRHGWHGDGYGGREGAVIPFDELTKVQLVELLKAHPSPDMRQVADNIMALDIVSALSLLDMLDDTDSVAADEDIGRDLGLPKGIALVIIAQLRRFLRALKRRGAVQWPPGDGVREDGEGLAAGQLWDSARLVSAIEREMGVMAADKRQRHGGKLQHVIDKIKEYGISGMSMSLLVEPPQDSDGSDEGRVEAALIDAAREDVFGGIFDLVIKSLIRRTISRHDQ
ncbi:unnamed protein product [Vitrella brassicaformis CCMP3155]|uniref:PHD-type domain-containing protein n=1 Tax=Vitrella brassicaformis (strain CCMP3155) TaxID=1169540 RepID=A0A0G4EYJ2_VITBC|nr:unnamed protein product [Vitrella brassicaformis CCMP3155]|eukprot:CEM04223.1 unnamed protein product [Vitrella brassicaformis CCMP3155]